MARIEGVILPLKKRVEYGLTYILGIGLPTSQAILRTVKVDFNKRVKDLSDAEVAAIQKEITKSYKTEGELRKQVALNIQRLKMIGSYRGLRHAKGLPVRGQRTKTNARTRKGPSKQPIALKRKVTKK
jgi:small subunit ribosomal protein S13